MEVLAHSRRPYHQRAPWPGNNDGLYTSHFCAPTEVRRLEDIRQAVDLVRWLQRYETTLAQEFPGYFCGKDNWLREAPRSQVEEARREVGVGTSGSDGTGELA